MALSMSMCFTSCDWSDGTAGELDGYWHLQRVDTLATGGRYMMDRKTVFWAVQDNVLETVIIPHPMVFFRFEHTRDELRIYDPVGTKDPTASDMDFPITDPTRLYDYGVHSLDAKFRILQHTSQHLLLQDDMLRLHFERY